ncbi:hypothetical protein SISSUDRAFT_1043926 [Sistotremastrum suecicum HHB10207 ss-3]|uniref:Uncharacterized protein n=1 Tax=Sistotremastrum suecicum HHB10207 ss-3 TaxID=1314776 RepID=A0A166FG78_9AGAM|nr:hypothetical protein SISSUDRAFT_1043926 [Sistotremastrum suecicum HHB10207 ss-3]
MDQQNSTRVKKEEEEETKLPKSTDLSLVPINQKINKSAADKQYRLEKQDIYNAGLEVEIIPRKVVNRKDTQLYFEWEVEQLAWKIHGGQQAFIRRLQALKLLYSYTHPGKSYDHLRPDSYAAFVDLYEMPRWIWNKCSSETTRLFPGQERANGTKLVRLLTREYVNSPYPSRPRIAPPSSPSFNLLRSILDTAPILPDGLKKTNNAERGALYILENPCPALGSARYEWSQGFLAALFHALNGVIADHGEGPDGWEAARWEVYDKASSALNSGLSYVPDTEKWIDPARIWLETPYLKLYKEEPVNE